LSDWEAASLSFQSYSTDTIVAPSFNVYSRYGRYPNEPQDQRSCNQHLNTNADPAHGDITPYYHPTPTESQAETLSEDGELQQEGFSSFYNPFLTRTRRRL
jgi:hypothetical protein